MKKLFGVLFGVLCVSLVVESALAIPFVDFNGDQTGPIFMSQDINPAHTWIFDLDNDALLVGDIDAEDTIASATLTVNLRDVSRPCPLTWFFDVFLDRVPETTDMMVDGWLWKEAYEIDSATYTLDVLASVYSDHYLQVMINEATGNFLVENMILHGEYDELTGSDASPVPEPATMLLFGCGLVGMATVGRKKFIHHT
jgi:hypothetical protein